MDRTCIVNPLSGRAIKTSGRTYKRITKGASTLQAAARRTMTAPAKKKRGRPKGSKNKPKS